VHAGSLTPGAAAHRASGYDFFDVDVLREDFFAEDLREADFLEPDFFPLDFLAVDFFAEDFRDDDFFAPAFFEADFLDDDFFGTLPPARRASESPIAIACLRLVTFLPERPLRSFPSLRSCIAFLTLDCAVFPYFAMSSSLLRRRGEMVRRCAICASNRAVKRGVQPIGATGKCR
jgi:hypothetical protein